MLDYFLSVMYNFKGDSVRDFMADHTDIPVAFVTLYLTLIFYVPTLMEKREPMKFKLLFTLWNLILTTFSVLGSYYCVPFLFRAVTEKGFYYSVCQKTQDYYYNGPSGFWVALFILSKIPELLDTVFLVVQKKEVIFLHWFHHVTVMLYCWHAYVHTISSGMWFATMNFAVHSIMYFYYFLTSIGARKLVKPIAPLITSLQLLQMIVGMVVTLATFIWRNSDKGCNVESSNSRMGLAMYTSYFILFALLFKKLYLSKKPASPTTRQQKSVCNVNVDDTDIAGRFMSTRDEASPLSPSSNGAAPKKKQ